MTIILRSKITAAAVLLLTQTCFAQDDLMAIVESPELLEKRTEKVDYTAYFKLNNTIGNTEKRPGFLSALELDLARNVSSTNAAELASGVSGLLQIYEADQAAPLLQQGRDVFSGLLEGLSKFTNGLPDAVLDDVLPPLTTSALILDAAGQLDIAHLQAIHAMGLQWQQNTLRKSSRPYTARGLLSQHPLPDRSDYSWSLWCKTAVSNTALISAVGRDRMSVRSAPTLCLREGRPTLRFNEHTLASAVQINDKEWHHVAFVVDHTGRDSADVSLWVNGTPAKTISISNFFEMPSRRWGYSVALGTAPGIEADFAGQLDDVRLYSTALPATRLATPSTLGTNHLATHWPLDAPGKDGQFRDPRGRWPLRAFAVEAALSGHIDAAAEFSDKGRGFLLPDPVFDLPNPMGAKRLLTASFLGRLFERDDDFSEARTRAAHHMRYVLERGDTGLREEPQASLALCTLINIARRLDRMDSLTSLESTFKKVHADTLPNASLPQHLRQYQLRWAYALETAARLFNQPQYIYSAQKHFLAFHSYHKMYPAESAGTPIYVSAKETHVAAGITSLPPMEMDSDTMTPSRLASVLKENAWQADAGFDTLVLRTGHTPAHAAVSLSLSPGLDGRHADQATAINMFTVGGVSLHEPAPPGASLGSEASLLWMQPIGIPYPFRQREAEALSSPGVERIDAAYSDVGFTWRGPGDTGYFERHLRLSSIETNQLNGDISARLTFEQYGTRGTALVRRLILTREGYLIIADVLSPGSDAQGYAAGQLWRIPANSSWVRNGGHWLSYILDRPEPILDQSDNPSVRGALIHFGDNWDDLYVGQKDDILFSQRTLTREPTTFAMACIPLFEGQQSPRTLARRVAIRVSGERAGVSLPGDVSVTSSPDKWTVTRPAP